MVNHIDDARCGSCATQDIGRISRIAPSGMGIEWCESHNHFSLLSVVAVPTLRMGLGSVSGKPSRCAGGVGVHLNRQRRRCSEQLHQRHSIVNGKISQAPVWVTHKGRSSGPMSTKPKFRLRRCGGLTPGHKTIDHTPRIILQRSCHDLHDASLSSGSCGDGFVKQHDRDTVSHEKSSPAFSTHQ